MKPKDDEKLKAIAEATFKLVEHTGLSGLTMADIARAAGIATSTLYVYYKSKDELVTALYEQAKTATLGRLLEGFDADLPYRARLRRVWLNLLHNRLEHYAEAVFQEQFITSPWYGESSRALSARAMAEWQDFLEQGQQQEILKSVPLPLLSACVTGSVRELASLIRGNTVPADEATLNTAFALCWDAIKA